MILSRSSKSGNDGKGLPPGSYPNSGDDSKEQEELREKEEQLRREEEEEQETERRRQILLDQDNALAQQEEIVNRNWEVLRGQRDKLSQEAHDLEQGIARRIHLERDPPSRLRRKRSNSRDSVKEGRKKATNLRKPPQLRKKCPAKKTFAI